ncbi:MAG: hypothetical protein HFE45_07370 [Oscillospiraceae bacterium]|jgi:hypothetical protein|nr:hypothetical protein [Oscillospiraceae bacterium]
MIVVNPVGAGGLTLSKLALANAVAANVLSGKKFYSGDKVLKTGTLSLTATATPEDVVAGKTFFAGGTVKKTGTLSLPKFKKGTISLPASIETTYIDIGFSPALIFVHYYYGSGNHRTDFYRCYRPYKFQSDSISWTIEAGEANGRMYLRNLGALDLYAEYYATE